MSPALGAGHSASLRRLPDGACSTSARFATAQRGLVPRPADGTQPDRLLDAGSSAWREVCEWLAAWRADHEKAFAHRLPTEGPVPVLLFTVADYVSDFYACEQHAWNAG
ncbi:hypothetical protein HBB16_03100 [Pseudonocardia sp. MCCB 268]|nr:hypothetical protein [Pseudonocardia cytotoxica]